MDLDQVRAEISQVGHPLISVESFDWFFRDHLDQGSKASLISQKQFNYLIESSELSIYNQDEQLKVQTMDDKPLPDAKLQQRQLAKDSMEFESSESQPQFSTGDVPAFGLNRIDSNTSASSTIMRAKQGHFNLVNYTNSVLDDSASNTEQQLSDLLLILSQE